MDEHPLTPDVAARIVERCTALTRSRALQWGANSETEFWTELPRFQVIVWSISTTGSAPYGFQLRDLVTGHLVIELSTADLDIETADHVGLLYGAARYSALGLADLSIRLIEDLDAVERLSVA